MKRNGLGWDDSQEKKAKHPIVIAVSSIRDRTDFYLLLIKLKAPFSE